MNFFRQLKEPGNLKVLIFHSSWSLTLTAGLSYFFGFVRDRIFAHTFGLSRTLDIYNASFVIPDFILTVFIGTALSAAFLPIFTKRYDEKRGLGYQYAQQVMSWGMLLIAVTGIIIAIALPNFAHMMVPGFDADDLKKYILLTRIELLAPLLFTLSNIYGRIIMSFKEFLWYGLSPAMYNLGNISGVLLFYDHFGIVGLVIGNVLGILMHLMVRLIIVKRPKYNFRHKINFAFSPEIIETIKLMLPKMLQYVMWSLMLMSFTGIASELSEGSIAAYNYARNFQSLPVSMLGIAIALSLYTSLSHDAGKGNFTKFKKDFKRDRVRALFYTTAAAVALALLAKPLVSLLLGGGRFGANDIRLVSVTLQLYCLSIPLETMLHIYHRSFYSLRNTIIPAVFHAINILLMIIVAKLLSPQIGVFAIPIGFTSGLAVHVTIMALIFPLLLKKRTLNAI